jgi:heme-NO-binding protein
MKGVIFNLAEQVLGDAHGPEIWDRMLRSAGVTGAYTSLGSYPDEELSSLVGAAAELLGTSTSEVLRTLGRGALPLLAERYPEFFNGHRTTQSFLLTLNDIIHAEVRKLYPGAVVPEFGFECPDPDTLILTYESPRKLCALAHGFIEGAAAHFGERADISQARCMLEGATSCEIRCRLTAAAFSSRP